MNKMRHLAVFDNDTTENIFSGKKRIESRFAKFKFPPYKKVSEGDEVFIKISGGQVVGKFFVGHVMFFENLNFKKIKGLKERYGADIFVPESFWRSKYSAKYATLMNIVDPEKLRIPFSIDKHDQRSWIIFNNDAKDDSLSQLSIQFSDKDSLSSLIKLLVTVGEKNGWFDPRTDLKDLVLRFFGDTALLSSCIENNFNKKDEILKEAVVKSFIDILALSRHLNIDLHREASDKIKKTENKKSIYKI